MHSIQCKNQTRPLWSSLTWGTPAFYWGLQSIKYMKRSILSAELLKCSAFNFLKCPRPYLDMTSGVSDCRGPGKKGFKRRIKFLVICHLSDTQSSVLQSRDQWTSREKFNFVEIKAYRVFIVAHLDGRDTGPGQLPEDMRSPLHYAMGSGLIGAQPLSILW